jgi:hypothetical protein
MIASCQRHVFLAGSVHPNGAQVNSRSPRMDGEGAPPYLAETGGYRRRA